VTRVPVLLRIPGERGWRSFSNPTQIFSARSAEAVIACLDDVQRAVEQTGCWAAGFVAYEAAAGFGLPVANADTLSLPLAWFGIFPPDGVALRERLDPGTGYSAGRWQPSMDRARYLAAVHEIKSRIAAGDTYQINYTFRLTATFRGDAISLLGDLDDAQRGPWGGYVDIGTHAICSASPELFFLLHGNRLECRPMKGTAPRGRSAEEDLRRAAALQQSAKNRAENVMVVDMTRNDLGRIALTGSVSVPSMFEVERYPGQWQMISTVAASTATTDLSRLFEALFPSGSVTGAPKRSSMAIIRDLETGPRGIYTGAIGCLTPGGRAHFNVAIRTVVIDRERHQAEFGVGSGIVWDSVDTDEYEECVNKAAMLTRRQEPFRLLETLRWSDSEGFIRLDSHLARMRASADYFGFDQPAEARVRAQLDSAVANRYRDARIRILLDRDGNPEIEAHELAAAPDPMRVVLAAEPVSTSDVFLFHKTTRRDVYERARSARPDMDAVLLWNERGEITEATEANIVLEMSGRRVTPPIDCGVLPGVLRGELLNAGEVEERVIQRDDLPRASRIWLISSVRGWMPAIVSQ